MFYVALVAFLKIGILTYVVLRLYVARNRQAHRANVNAERWHETRRLLGEATASNAWLARDLKQAQIRLEEIRATITRRPPRRRWLRICHRVAGLADTTTRGVRWPA